MGKRLFTDTHAWCPTCKCMKPFNEFGVDNYKSSRRDGYCKICRKEYDTRYRPRRVHYTRMRRYGISREEYEKMLEKQNGLCAICRREKKNKRLVVDHDHKTKKVRGILCDGCNIMLGHYEDDINMIQKAIDYLKNSQ